MVSLSHPNFSLFYDTSNDKNGYLLHFQSCMKHLNISYNPIIQQNVNNMICKILQERYYYMYLSECNKLYTQSSSLYLNYESSERKCKEIQARLDFEIAKNQQLLEKTTILEYDNNSVNQKYQELVKKNKSLEESNIELNQKIIELKQKAKSVKECEEFIGLKNEEIERMKEQILADKKIFDKYQNQIHNLKTQVTTTKENLEKSNVENEKLQNQLSTLQNNFLIADQKFKELQQRFDSINSQNQQLLKKNKILEESNFGQSQKVTGTKNDKNCEELLNLKNEEIERMKKEIQELIKEKEMIIIEFGERELQEQIKSKELEKKLKEYENQRKRFTSEIDKACGFVMEGVSRKRPKTTNNENQKIFANLSKTKDDFLLKPDKRQNENDEC
uniref:Uncharacterized protein n=1 Tax=Panagrolaimus davidi TaxID=227884 RepID=A0A914PUS6_9BILA